MLPGGPPLDDNELGAKPGKDVATVITNLLEGIYIAILKNQPSGITGWIGLNSRQTIPISSTITLFDVSLPTMTFGALKGYQFYFIGGDINALSFKLTVANNDFPQVYNLSYPGDIVGPPFDFQEMHYDVKSRDRVKVTVTNTSAFVVGDVGARIKGWYY